MMSDLNKNSATDHRSAESKSTDLTDASQPSKKDLDDALEELMTYRHRLVNDVVAMGQRLKLPRKQVEHNLSNHHELLKIDEIMIQLQSQSDG